MPLVKPDQWKPIGILDLEPSAWQALRHASSAYVVAGPGAGKTEFLAQRAAYLLQTGSCCQPARILAISFKTDAADNLAKRVRERCAPELANRFSSMTFDAFTKGLVDRFLEAIPQPWRPTREYDVFFPRYRDHNDFLTRARLAAPKEIQAKIATVNANLFEPRLIGSFRLPEGAISGDGPREFLIRKWFDETLAKRPKSLLTFVELNRLAELLVRVRPEIRDALRYSHPFVFVDEFQDTTFAQYDFLKSVFGGGHAVLTAVGDEKQRIMVWAGARDDAFGRFSNDFKAKKFELLFNFRSSPGLVQIQHVVAQALDPNAARTVSQTAALVSDDVAKIWKCSSEASEAEQLAAWISKDISARGLKSRDYAIIVRQTADKFEESLRAAFTAKGISLRNEAKSIGRLSLQDLLTEPIALVAISVLRLGAVPRCPEAWSFVSEAMPRIRNIDPQNEVGLQRSERELLAFLSTLRTEMKNTPSADAAKALADRVFTFLNLDDVSRAFLEYHKKDALEIAVEGFLNHLASSAETTKSWPECIDAFEGNGQIPLMTVHKSKGLEYDTIVFVGLDDSAWWSYSSANPEGLATFFVALSRAKQRAIFTFCQSRGDRKKIADLYRLLADAGVQEQSV